MGAIPIAEGLGGTGVWAAEPLPESVAAGATVGGLKETGVWAVELYNADKVVVVARPVDPEKVVEVSVIVTVPATGTVTDGAHWVVALRGDGTSPYLAESFASSLRLLATPIGFGSANETSRINEITLKQNNDIMIE